MRSLGVLLILFANLAWADVLVPDLPAFSMGPNNPVNNEAKEEPNCDEIIPRLEAYSQDIYNHNQSVLGFLDQVAQTASRWQTLLFPLENQYVLIPEGKFSSLKDNSAAIDRITSYAYDNSAYFAGELDQIITALRNCKR